MRIAQVAPLFESVPPQLYGGTERIVHYLTEELISRGHEVVLFASGDSKTSAELVPGSVRALRSADPSCDHFALHMLMLEKVYARHREFDIIHFHVDHLHFPFSRRMPAPQVTTLHGRQDLPHTERVYREYGEMPLISISHSQRRPVPYARWAANVYHGLPEDLYRYNALPEGYLAFIGRVSPEKRLDRAIEIACQSGRRLKVAAKVDKADKEYFEHEIKPLLAAPGVEFIGEIGEREKQEFLGNAEALLFPIDWPEPFGMVMIEAMACGTPVIAYRNGSVEEVVSEGTTGYIVESIAEAVEAVGRISEISRRNCRMTFEKRFTAKIFAENYERVYCQEIERFSSPVSNILPFPAVFPDKPNLQREV